MSLSSILNDSEQPIAGPSSSPINRLQPRRISSPNQPSSSQFGAPRSGVPSSSSSTVEYFNGDVLMDDEPQHIASDAVDEDGNLDTVEDEDDDDEEAVDGQFDENDEEDDEEDDEEGDGDGVDDPDADNQAGLGEGEEEDDDEDEDDEDSDADDAASEDLEGGDNDDPDDIVVTGVNIVVPRTEAGETLVKTEPGLGTEATIGGDSEAPITVLKPKRKRKRPPVDDLPPPPPPMKTIRLERDFALGAETLEWNILDDARANGMVSEIPIDILPEPEDVFDKPDGLNGEGGPAGTDLHSGIGGLFGVGEPEETPEAIAARLEAKYDRPKKTIKRRAKDDMYDFKDEFIDDSELNIDAPTHMGRAKREGFFVHSGPLELVMDTPPAKSRSVPKKTNKRPPPPRDSLAVLVRRRRKQQHGKGFGSSDLPILLDDEDEDGPVASSSRLDPLDGEESIDEGDPIGPIPVDRSKYKFAATDPTLLPPFATFPRPVAVQLMRLHKASEDHQWLPDQRSKFPEKLKPEVKKLATVAMENDVFGRKPGSDRLYLALPSVLPYNKLTLTKLIVKLSHKEYDDFLKECIRQGIALMKKSGDEGMEDWNQKREIQMKRYNDQLAQWAWQRDRVSGQLAEDGSEAPAEPPAVPKRTALWTAEMKEVFWQLVDITQEQYDVTQWAHDKGELRIPTIRAVSDKVIRKELYDSIAEKFDAETGITNAFLSKEMSNYKARRGKKEPADGGAQRVREGANGAAKSAAPTPDGQGDDPDEA